MSQHDLGGFYNILIIDDEKFILDIFSHYLADQGFNVQIADNDTDALNYLKSTSFDLVLLDVCLKSADFSTVLSRIKSPQTSHGDVPVIAVTGKPSSIPRQDFGLIRSLLVKPFTPNELISFIQSEMGWIISD
ncbi:MAG: response regulator [Candidatus Marinamargulisbacteria bacterium]